MGAFARKGFPSPTILVTNLHRPKATFLVAPAILAAAGLLFGLAPGRLDDTLDDYAETLPAAGAADGHYTLTLWHGFNLPLLLSVLVLALGAGGVLRPQPAAPGRDSTWLPLGNADRIYDAVVRGADVASVRLTAVTSAARFRPPRR